MNAGFSELGSPWPNSKVPFQGSQSPYSSSHSFLPKLFSGKGPSSSVRVIPYLITVESGQPLKFPQRQCLVRCLVIQFADAAQSLSRTSRGTSARMQFSAHS